jgi:predicted amidohydrolase
LRGGLTVPPSGVLLSLDYSAYRCACAGYLLRGFTRAVDIARARDNAVMIVRADVAGCTADRVSFGSSAIVDARGTVLQAGEALKEDILAAEVHAAREWLSVDPPRFNASSL